MQCERVGQDLPPDPCAAYHLFIILSCYPSSLFLRREIYGDCTQHFVVCGPRRVFLYAQELLQCWRSQEKGVNAAYMLE
jgi:hypothetical protein